MVADESQPIASIPVAIVIGLLAALVQSFGLTLQRKSHLDNESRPCVPGALFPSPLMASSALSQTRPA